MSEKNKNIKNTEKPIVKKAGKPTKSTSTYKINYAKEAEMKAYNKMSYKEQGEHNDRKYDEEQKILKKTIRSKGYSFRKITKYIMKVVGNENPQIKRIKNTKYNGQDVISIRVNKGRSLDWIKYITEELSEKLSKKKVNGKIATALLYGDLGWKSGYLRRFGEEAKFYDPNELYNLEVPYNEPRSIPSYNIYIALGSKPEGGNDINNDCLYNCLKYYVFNIEKYYKSPADLKRQLKLNRNDKIPLEYIDTIEKKLKTFKINVRGEYMRTSTIKSNKEINLILNNEHYVIEPNTRTFTPFIKYDEKLPVMWDKKTFEAFDGVKKWVMSREERNKIIYDFKSPHIIINRENQGRDENDEPIIISIEEEYKQFLVIADTLKKESKGLINLYKSGSYYSASLSLFERLTKFINPEDIKQDENEFIKNCVCGAFIWCEEYEGELYKYDVKSLYPYLMISNTSKFPLKRGEHKNIEDFHPEYFEYGIYRSIVYESDNENTNKLFRFNNANYYNSIDLTEAKKLGLKIELIKDDKPNFLYYSPDKLITFFSVFKDYIDILFDLKEKKVNKSKSILNILWGALCEKNKRKQYIDDNFSIDDDEEILEMYPSNTDDNNHNIKTIKINNYYKNNFARLCPFLLSYGRRHMANILKDNIEYVKRVQTDGFLITKKLHNDINVEIGGLKYEGYTMNGIIKNKMNKVPVNY